MDSFRNKTLLVLLVTLIPAYYSVSAMSTLVINGTLNQTYTNQVNISVQILYQFSINSSSLYTETGHRNVLRAFSSSQASNAKEPVTIVVSQKKGVLSWELPVLVGSMEYPFAYRTLCPYDKMKTLSTSKDHIQQEEKMST